MSGPIPMTELREGSSTSRVQSGSSTDRSRKDTVFIKRHDGGHEYTSGPDTMQYNLMLLPCLSPCVCCFSRSYCTDVKLDSNKKEITHSQSGSCCFLLGLLPCFYTTTTVGYGDVANIVLSGPGACECVNVEKTEHVKQYTSDYFRLYIYLKGGKALPLTCRHRSIRDSGLQSDFGFLYREIFGLGIAVPDMSDNILYNI